MVNLDSLLRFFNIKRTESRLIAFLIAYSFCMGGAMAVYYTVVVSTFLTSFGSGAIPGSYIVGGLLVLVLGWLIARTGNKASFQKRSEIQLILLVVSVTALSLGYHLTQESLLIFALFIWNRVFVLVHGVTFWAAVSKILDLQQSKRLYGLINSGEVLASVLAYFSVPLLIRLISPDMLLYIVIGLLVCCSLIQQYVHRNFLSRARPLEVETGSSGPLADHTVDVKRSAFSKNISLLALIPVFSLLYIEYLFFVESRESFPDRDLLAGFLGLFFGVCALFEAIIKGFLYHKLLSRYGVKAGIIILPVSLIFSFSLATIYGYAFSADTIVFFAFIVLARFFMSAVRKSVTDPAFQVLYQAIPGEIRLFFQNRIEGRAKAIGGLLAGVLLWLLFLIPGISNIDLAAAFLPVAVGWLLLTLRGQKLYRLLILDRLKQPDPATGSRDFGISPPHDRQHPLKSDAQARLETARALGDSLQYNAYQKLIPLLQDPEVMVRREAISSAGKLSGNHPEIRPFLFELLNNEAYSESAIRALQTAGESVFAEIEKRLLAGAESEEVQLKFLDLVTKAGNPKSIKILRSQLSNPKRRVAGKAIEGLLALGYRPNTSESNRLLLLLEDSLMFYTWVIAADEDLGKKYASSHTLIKALIIEREKLTVFMFSILAFVYHKSFALITEIVKNRKADLRGLLIEVCDIELSGQLKTKIKTLLATDFSSEILSELRVYYPQFTLTVPERLYELINQDFTRLSIWTKSIAMKEMHKNYAESYPEVFSAFAVTNFRVLAQTALYSLKDANPVRFAELKEQLAKIPDSYHSQIFESIEMAENEDQLLVCRLSRLRFVDALKRTDDHVLGLIARHSNRFSSNHSTDVDLTRYAASDPELVVIITYGELFIGAQALSAGVHFLSIVPGESLTVNAFSEVYLIPRYILPDFHQTEVSANSLSMAEPY